MRTVECCLTHKEETFRGSKTRRCFVSMVINEPDGERETKEGNRKITEAEKPA